ncbi:retrovirus-related pol polyprotein from transposon TNT 1-94 [Tanacetum coccineum]
MEADVEQYHVDKQCFEIQKKQILIENNRLLDQIISQDIVNIFVNSSMDINTSVNVNSSVAINDSVNCVEMCNKCLELEAELIKQHNMVEKDEYNRLSKSFSKLEQHCISLELHTMEQAAILREIVEQAKSLNPLDSAFYSTCKFVKLIQEVLGYVRDTCPDIHKPGEKLVAVSLSHKNNSSKSKSIKKSKKKEAWKPTGKVFTKIGYSWIPTGRTFTLVRNVCPLTRITATNKVPLREPIPLEVTAQAYVVTKVYTRIPKIPKTNGSNSKPKIAKSVISNKMEPDTSWGSNTSVAPSSSSCVDLRRNCTLVEAARTMLIYAKAPLFLWARQSLPHVTPNNDHYTLSPHGKKLLMSFYMTKKPDLSYLRIFGALCYPNNYSEDLGKLKAKADIGIFIGYEPKKKAYCIYNRCTRKIIETIHVDFDELTAMTSEQLVPVPAAPRAVDLADSPVSTSIDQDAPSTKPIYFKQGITEPSSIDAMQEEIHEFERLQVWELVSCPDRVMLIKLKWIYKVKTDKFGGVLKNKARLVAQGFRQEEGINFEESFAPVARIEHEDKSRNEARILLLKVAWNALASSSLLFLPGIPYHYDNKKFSVNVEVFIDILNICPRIPGKEFDEPPSEGEALSFI